MRRKMRMRVRMKMSRESRNDERRTTRCTLQSHREDRARGAFELFWLRVWEYQYRE
jgi:hypothetical protein